ncbi:hypothetical protein Syun_022956 [Stephania yunnanensis]|uniref:Zinc-finger domain-containing protein n=1 Tax=Stephania yunnanensis TaxID=152371 RepID=A0AAP0F7Z7_9MAGN
MAVLPPPTSPSNATPTTLQKKRKKKKNPKSGEEQEKEEEKRSDVGVEPKPKRKYNKTKKTQVAEEEKEKENGSDSASPRRKRNKSPGVRLVGSRIYDSQNGKTCHQCRQKTMDFSASCKNQKEDKACRFRFCYKCLLNRYGEKAEEMELLGDWKCPKCRGICNCSFCMKRRGHQPTGILSHTAKATGFSSVSEMLQVRGPENISASPKKLPSTKVEASLGVDGEEKYINDNDDLNLQKKSSGSDYDGRKVKGTKKRKSGNYNTANGNERDDNEADDKKAENAKRFKSCQVPKKAKGNSAKEVKRDISDGDSGSPVVEIDTFEKSCSGRAKNEEELNTRDNSSPTLNQSENCNNVEENPKQMRGLHKVKKNATRVIDAPLPEGIGLKTIAGIDFPVQDIGHALQFLEFCKAFEEVLDLKEGFPESVLHELMHGCGRRSRQYSSIVHFRNQLLGLIQQETGQKSLLTTTTNNGDSWAQGLCKCMFDSHYALKEFPFDCFDIHGEGYKKLDTTKKLRLLNFLCDEALGTENLRSWIDEQNSKAIERRKKAKEKVLAAKEKERGIKCKMQNNIAKAILLKNGAPLSVSEHENLVSKIKSETAEAHARTLEAVDMLQKETSDVVRTSPLFLDKNGHAFWRLRGYSVEPTILCQEIGGGDLTSEEKWFAYDVEQKRAMENYISSLRGKRLRIVGKT